jgi:hypothetical protein
MIKKFLAPVLFSLLALIWILISLRVEILPLAVLMLSLPFMPFAKKKVVWSACVFIVVCSYPLSPIALTFNNSEGLPKLVGYCNVREVGGMETAYENQCNGNCIIASDIVSALEAEKFIVW